MLRGKQSNVKRSSMIIINREAQEIIRLVVSVCLSICPFVLSCLNCLTYGFSTGVEAEQVDIDNWL